MTAEPSDEPLSQAAVVVVNYGVSELLRANLSPISASAPELLVVVVDSFSTPHEREACRRLAQEQGWCLEAPPDNVGFGGGVNLGVRRARAEGRTVFVVLNPDATIAVDDVAALVRACARAATPTLLGPVIRRPDGTVWSCGGDLYLRTGELRSQARRTGASRELLPWLTGACVVADERVWDLVGGFDERYFMYWEDVDLSIRLLAAGGAVEVLPEATAVHDQGGTQVSVGPAKSALYYYYNIRNRLWCGATHGDAAAYRRWLLATPRQSWSVIMRGGRRQLLASPMPWVMLVRGVWDGVRGGRRLRSEAAQRAAMARR